MDTPKVDVGAVVRTGISALTFLLAVGAIIYRIAIIDAKVSENSTAIAERKLTGKTVRQHGNRITKLETHHEFSLKAQKFLSDKNLRQDQTIEDIRVRVRELEKK